MRIPEQTTQFKTCDLPLAAYLHAKNIPLIGIERIPDRRNAFFVFELNPQEGDQLSKEFLKDSLVPAKSYSSAMRDLKILLHNY